MSYVALGSLGANPFICPFANGDRQEYALHNIKASVNLTMTISNAVSALGDRTLVWMSFVVSKMRFQWGLAFLKQHSQVVTECGAAICKAYMTKRYLKEY